MPYFKLPEHEGLEVWTRTEGTYESEALGDIRARRRERARRQAETRHQGHGSPQHTKYAPLGEPVELDRKPPGASNSPLKVVYPELEKAARAASVKKRRASCASPPRRRAFATAAATRTTWSTSAAAPSSASRWYTGGRGDPDVLACNSETHPSTSDHTWSAHGGGNGHCTPDLARRHALPPRPFYISVFLHDLSFSIIADFIQPVQEISRSGCGSRKRGANDGYALLKKGVQTPTSDSAASETATCRPRPRRPCCRRPPAAKAGSKAMAA